MTGILGDTGPAAAVPATRVNSHLEWALVVISVSCGVAPRSHCGDEPSTITHRSVEAIGELATIWAVTAPGPSLVKVKTRDGCGKSMAESTIRFVNVIVAVGDVCGGTDEPAVGVVLCATVGEWLGSMDGEVPLGVAAGPDAPLARLTAAIGELLATGFWAVGGADDPANPSTRAAASIRAVARRRER